MELLTVSTLQKMFNQIKDKSFKEVKDCKLEFKDVGSIAYSSPYNNTFLSVLIF